MSRLLVDSETLLLSKTVPQGGDATLSSLHVVGAAQVDGDLTVTGTTTTISSATLEIEDPVIDVNKSGGAVAATGIRAITPSGAAPNKRLIYVNISDSWKAGTEGAETTIIQAPVSAADNVLVRFDGTEKIQGFTSTAITASDSGALTIANPTATTSTATGALIVSAGGAGISGNVYAGGVMRSANLFTDGAAVRNAFLSSAIPTGPVTGTDNVAVGHSALTALTSASGCVAVGSFALSAASNPNMNQATCVGYRAGASATNSQRLSLFGYRAGDALTTGGFDNSGFGYNSLYACVSGSSNSVFGSKAGYALTGNYSTFVGAEAGLAVTASSNDVLVGRQAAVAYNPSSNGGGNVVVGASSAASWSTTAGTRNSVLLGYLANSSAGTENTLVLGYQATATASNQIVLGTTAHTELKIPRFTAAGLLETSAAGVITKRVPTYGMAYTDGGGALTVSSSSQRYALHESTTASANLSDVTFTAGTSGTISSVADVGGVARFTTGAAHGLTTGQIITINGTTNYNGIATVTATPAATTFETALAYIAGDSGAFQRPFTLSPGTTGVYEAAFAASVTPSADAPTFALNMEINAGTASHATALFMPTLLMASNPSIRAVVSLTAGAVLWFSIIRSAGTGNPVFDLFQFTLHRVD